MKQIIPFKKEIIFKTMISKVTSISLEHTLELKDEDTIMGDFIVCGSYKMTEASQLDEEFSYKVPIEITIDDKYDTSNVTLEIDDFTYEVLDEEKLLLNIDLCIDNLELKPKLEEVKKEEVIKVEGPKEEVISSYDDGYEEIIDELTSIGDRTDDKVENEEKEISVDRHIDEAKTNEFEKAEDECQEKRCIDKEEVEDLFLDTSKKEKLEIPMNQVSTTNNSNSSIDMSAPQIIPYYPSNNSNGENNNPNHNNNTNGNTNSSVNNEVDNDTNVASIFSAFKNTDETFSTYYIYIMREGDSLDTVLNKYKVTRDALAEYNDLSDIRIGSKIIVPSIHE